MNMRLNWPTPPAPAADIMPLVSMAEIQNGLVETGLMVEQTFQLGLISTWLLVPDVFEECLCDSRELPRMLAALEVPDDVESDRLVHWLLDEQKTGWLIRINLMMGPATLSPAPRRAGGWFYNERLDLALVEAIRWAKGGA